VPDWTAFGAVAGFVLFLVLGLAWITSGAFAGRSEETELPAELSTAVSEQDTETCQADTRGKPVESDDSTQTSSNPDSDIDAVAPSPGATPDVRSIPTAALLANVLFTHGGMGLLLLGAAAMTGIPAAALGVEGTAWSTGGLAVGGGLAAGAGLAAVNAGLAASLDRIGIEHNEDLRRALAPESATGWLVLLVVVLPLVAGFEELLFRAILIGAATTATGLSPWLFVVLSTIAFALGHGLQGKGGIAVTGLLGGALGVAFVLTNSLLLVVIAHYVVNAVEFLLKEWLAVALDGRI